MHSHGGPNHSKKHVHRALATEEAEIPPQPRSTRWGQLLIRQPLRYDQQPILAVRHTLRRYAYHAPRQPHHLRTKTRFFGDELNSLQPEKALMWIRPTHPDAALPT